MNDLDHEDFRHKMNLVADQYEALTQNKELWNQELEERKELDRTLMDGLEDEIY